VLSQRSPRGALVKSAEFLPRHTKHAIIISMNHWSGTSHRDFSKDWDSSSVTRTAERVSERAIARYVGLTPRNRMALAVTGTVAPVSARIAGHNSVMLRIVVIKNAASRPFRQLLSSSRLETRVLGLHWPSQESSWRADDWNCAQLKRRPKELAFHHLRAESRQ
jgi:hypothetical protein